MTAFADETLMAYADGELDAAESARVAAALAADPALAERAAAFVRTGRPIAALYAPILSEELPQKLVDSVFVSNAGKPQGLAPASRGSRAAADTLWVRLFGDASPMLTWGQAGLACSVALGLGLAAGLGLMPAAPSTSSGFVEVASGALQANGAFGQILETVASGQPGTLAGADSGQVIPRLSFQTASKDYCRQYTLTTDDRTQFEGLACRRPDGKWLVRVHEPMAFAVAAGGTVPASGAESPVVESAVDKLIAGDVLSREEEAKVLAGHWASSAPPR